MRTLRATLALTAMLASAAFVAPVVVRAQDEAKPSGDSQTVLRFSLMKESSDSTAIASPSDVSTAAGILTKRLKEEAGVRVRPLSDGFIEIVLAHPTTADIERVERYVKPVGLLEFKVLVCRLRTDWAKTIEALELDRLRQERDNEPDRLPSLPLRFRWVKLGEEYFGRSPRFTATSVTDSIQQFPVGKFANRAEVTLIEFEEAAAPAPASDGDDDEPPRSRPVARVQKHSVTRLIASNTADSLTFQAPHGLKRVDSYSISLISSGARNLPASLSDAPYLRALLTAPGHKNLFALCYEDPHRVTGDTFQRLSRQKDQNGRDSIRFEFDTAGSAKYIALQREFQPPRLDPDGPERSFTLAVLLDNEVVAARGITDLILDRGIIRGGGPNGFAEDDLRRLLAILSNGALPGRLNPAPPADGADSDPAAGDSPPTKRQR